MYQEISKNLFLSEILEVRKYSDECIYKNSMFNVVVEHGDVLLIYNTMSKLFVATEQKYKSIFCDTKEINSNSLKLQTDLVFFVHSGLLIEREVDELQLYQEVHNLVRTIEGENKSIERYNILTTTGCNARCFYCFEEGIKPVHMTMETAENVVQYIDRTRNKSKTIFLRWFGGEPLVNPKVIDHISSRLGELNIDFISSMSSNGYLFNDEIVEKASKAWNLRKVRVSFDGMEEEHSRRKNYYSKGNSFQQTVDNIDRLIAVGINVDIRLTLDHDNKMDIEKVAKYMVNRYQGTPYVKIYTRCLFEELTSEAAKKDIKKVSELVEFKEKIDDYLRKEHMFDYTRLLPIGYQPYYCAANDPHKEVIGPDGSLCSCETIEKNSLFWGNVIDGVTDVEYRNEWLESETPLEKCRSCRFLPSCTPFRKCPNDYFDCVGRCHTAYSNYLVYKFNEYKDRNILSS